MNTKYVICIYNENYANDLSVRKVYPVIPDEVAEQAQMIRIVDETGEDYLYPAQWFVPVELPVESAEALAKIAA